jgi:hypothetical protein
MRPAREFWCERSVSVALGVPVAALVLLLLGSAAAATTLTLSDCSNNEQVAAKWLDAEVSFSVSGNTLTLEVINNTPESEQDPWFRVNAVYFNVPENVTGLALQGAEGWSVEVSQDTYLAGDFLVGGFGWFDVRLQGVNGSSPYQVYPGQSMTFTFDIAGDGPFSEADFATSFSAPQGGHILSVLAAKFAGDEMSSFGNAAPEPATLLLMALGSLGLLWRRRRRGPSR